MYLATRGFCCTGSAGIRSPLGQRGLGPAPRALDARHSSAGGASHASETGACGIEAGGPSVSPANSCSSARRSVLSSVDSAPQCPSGIVATAVVAAFVRAAGTDACDGLSGARAVSAAKFGQVARSGTPAALAPSNPPTSSAMPFVLIRMLPTPTLPLQITLAYILAIDIPPARGTRRRKLTTQFTAWPSQRAACWTPACRAPRRFGPKASRRSGSFDPSTRQASADVPLSAAHARPHPWLTLARAARCLPV